jgi:hypothetical protein
MGELHVKDEKFSCFMIVIDCKNSFVYILVIFQKIDKFVY